MAQLIKQLFRGQLRKQLILVELTQNHQLELLILKPPTLSLDSLCPFDLVVAYPSFRYKSLKTLRGVLQL